MTDPRAILTLLRVSNLPTVWMNVLTAVVLATGGALDGVPLLALSLSAFYCGGMGLNDIFDREHDAREQAFRPIPSGRIGLPEAAAVTAFLFGLGFGLLFAAPYPGALLWAVGLFGVIFAYDRWHKEFPGSVLLMASCRLGVYLVCGHAVAGEISAWVFGAGLAQFVWTVAVTAVARWEGTREERLSFPLIPRMIAAMSILDGLVLTLAVSPLWLLAGVAAAALTLLGQRWVRGD